MRRRILALVTVAPLLLAACSVSPGEKVTVRIDDKSIRVTPASATSGRVRLEIDSLGDQTHDLALIIAESAAELPRTPEGKLDLTANRPIDEIEPFKPGAYIATSPNLPAGEYLVVCTLHVEKLKVAKFVVKARKKQVGG